MNSTDTLFNPKDVNRFYKPRITKYTRLGSVAGLTPASTDKFKTLVIPIDIQNDFHYKWGTLCVDGALADLSRFLKWFYKNTPKITAVMPTLDTHAKYQIFFAEAWLDMRTGNHPDPFTVIHSNDVFNGRMQCIFGYEWALRYTQTLEAKGKSLIIWPPHTMLGTDGQKLVPALAEAIAYHSAARSTQSIPIIKCQYPKSEHYGVYGPEVSDGYYGMDKELLESVNTYDRRIYAGQANDFCLLTSVQQDVDYLISINRQEDIKKIIVLMDCSSSVIKFPDVEWTKLQNLGVTLTDSLSLVL